ncbi:MAG: hypothetical protein LBK60_10030 [Verrucomicrobiales bacterium]|nr:hypothetical protein [Verrucomicrobiales bacterium]
MAILVVLQRPDAELQRLNAELQRLDAELQRLDAEPQSPLSEELFTEEESAWGHGQRDGV